MAINDELLYEVNDQGERVLVKSIESTQQAFIRFSNLTKRPVDVWWRDFQGKGRHYVRLKPQNAYDLNSYITHPWEFTDAATKEPYCVKNRFIFRAPPNVDDRQCRTNWNITIRVRSLRDTALLAVAAQLPRAELALELDIPRDLQSQLQELTQKIRHEAEAPI